MGELQEKILGHMLECTSELENTNHISKALGLAQPTIFKSIRLLEKEKYVQTRQESLRGIRTLKLTDKGVAAALLAGKEKDKIYAYLRRCAPSSSILILMNIIKDKKDLDNKWMRLFIYYMLHEEQKKESEKKNEELIASLIAGPENSFVDARKLGDLLNLNQLYVLLNLLRNKTRSINIIIDLLESKVSKGAKSSPERSITLREQELADEIKKMRDKLESISAESHKNTIRYSSALGEVTNGLESKVHRQTRK